MSDHGEDARRYAPAAARNRDPILDVLRRHVPASGLVLEVASGSGEHAAHFAAALPALGFQPSDPDPANRASCDAWARHAGLTNLRPAVALDATIWPWPVGAADLVIASNMIHIAPWAATLGLMRGARAVLPPGGALFLYGPFRREGRHTAPSNAEFDASLRARDPSWGVRDLEAVTEAAEGFAVSAIEAMPANNLCMVFRRR